MVRLSTQNTLCLLAKPTSATQKAKSPTTNKTNKQQTTNKTTTSTNNNNNTLVTHSTLHCHWYINNKSPVSPAGKKSFFFVLADVGLGSGFTVQVLRGMTLATARGHGLSPHTIPLYHSGVNAFQHATCLLKTFTDRSFWTISQFFSYFFGRF